MTRTDIPLIKHLAHTMSIEAAGVYNRLPLFLMPEESDELGEGGTVMNWRIAGEGP